MFGQEPGELGAQRTEGTRLDLDELTGRLHGVDAEAVEKHLATASRGVSVLVFERAWRLVSIGFILEKKETSRPQPGSTETHHSGAGRGSTPRSRIDSRERKRITSSRERFRRALETVKDDGDHRDFAAKRFHGLDRASDEPPVVATSSTIATVEPASSGPSMRLAVP